MDFSLESLRSTMESTLVSLPMLETILEALRTNQNAILYTSATLGAFYILFVRKISGTTKSEYTIRCAMPSDGPYNGPEGPIIDCSFIKPMDGWLKCTLLRVLVDTRFKKYFLTPKVRQALKMDILRNVVLPEVPTHLPIVRGEAQLYEREGVSEVELLGLVGGSRDKDNRVLVGICEVSGMYRSGQLKPTQVVDGILNFVRNQESDAKPLRCFVEINEEMLREHAAASERRWASGTPLSIIDGVPVAVKDEFHVAGHNVRCGLPFVLNTKPRTLADEKGLVRILREAGALIVGMSNMHQFGTGVTGFNQSKLHGTPRNPYNVDYCTGGSSSGSAAAVAAGLSVFALGTDGGGSIRMPAVACGLVGLKATYGAYPHTGKQSGTSVGHTGALCSSVCDAAITHALFAGKDHEAAGYAIQPPVTLPNFEIQPSASDLRGLKVGVDRDWLKYADPVMREACETTLQWLRDDYDVEVVDIHIPEKTESIVAHATLIGSEMNNNTAIHRDTNSSHVNIDVLSVLDNMRDSSAHDYLQAAKQRTRAINALKYVFTCCDVVITAPYGSLHPKITPTREKYGYADLQYTVESVRFVGLMNLTGVPALSLPVRYTKDNLPVGVQLFSGWWKEELLFKVGYAIERRVRQQKPQVWHDITQGQS